MNRRINLLTIAVAGAATVASPASANSAGAIPGADGSPASFGLDCTACHAQSAGPWPGSLELLDAPDEYVLGAMYDMTVRVTDPDQVGAGFELGAENDAGDAIGTLVVADPGATQYPFSDFRFLTHTGAGVADSISSWAKLGGAEYQVRWRAPSKNVGPLAFYVAANAINDNGSPSGDRAYLMAFEVSAPGGGCNPDVTGDGQVNVFDLLAVLDAWGPCPGCAADITGDGVVNVFDLLEVLDAWGPC